MNAYHDGQFCEGCPLASTRDPQPCKGPEDAPFVLVTDIPSCKPTSWGRLLSREAASVFMKLASGQNFRPEDFYLVPHIRCPHDPDLLTAAQKRAVKKSCRPYLEATLNTLKPRVIIPLGANAATQTYGRGVKISTVRGIPERLSEFPESVMLPMIAPAQAVLYPQHEAVLASDLATLGRLVDHDYDTIAASKVGTGDYEYVDDLQFLIDAGPTKVAFDTEGTSLRWFAPDAQILTMQFCIEPGKAYMLPWGHPEGRKSQRQRARLRKQLSELLCHPDRVVVGQNVKYDLNMLWRETGLRFRIGGDTLMLAALLDENSYDKGLDDLVKRYVPEMAGYSDRFDSTVDKSRLIEHPLDQEFLDYGCGDADGTFRLDEVLYPQVQEDEMLLTYYHNVSLAGLDMFAGIETRGLNVDEGEVEVFEAFMEQQLAEMYASLLSQVPSSIKRKHIDKGLKFSRHDFLRDILFLHPDGFRLRPRVFTATTQKLDDDLKVPSTSTKDHLPYFYDTCPFTFELSEYIKSERILSSNVKGFKKKYIVDGMVRPTYSLHKAVTGRSASEDPNGQNFPKRGKVAKAYRKLYVAPPGCAVIEADYSQAELRIAGDMANESVFRRIYESDGDIHLETALIVTGMTAEQFAELPEDERKLARTKAKAVNFGFLYGMGWRKFIVYAKTQYGVEFTEREARRIREAFFSRYPGLAPWHVSMRRFAHEHGYVRSYSGRIRHLPMIMSSEEGVVSEAERQAINSPVQEFGSTLGVLAGSRIHQQVDEQYLALVGFVHDALYAYVPLQYVEWGVKTMKWYMESNPLEELFNRRMKIPIVADVGVGLNLGDIHELGKVPTREDGSVVLGDYDWGALWDEDKQTGLLLPTQEVPPNGGFLPEGVPSLRLPF